nr:MAG TPA: hypothetical protein [Caudoviricetes sp.]
MITVSGITVNPIGDTGFEPVTLPVLPVLRTTISNDNSFRDNCKPYR